MPGFNLSVILNSPRLLGIKGTKSSQSPGELSASLSSHLSDPIKAPHHLTKSTFFFLPSVNVKGKGKRAPFWTPHYNVLIYGLFLHSGFSWSQ